MKQKLTFDTTKRLEDFFAAGLRDSVDEMFKIICLAFTHSFDGFCVTRGDGVMVVVNKAAASYLGLPPEALLNRHVKDVVDEKHYDLSTALEVIKERKKLTRIYNTRDGRSILNTSIPIFDDQGSIRYVVQNERDITQIKELEDQLQQERAVRAELLTEMRQLKIQSAGHRLIANSSEMKNILSLIERCGRLELDSLLMLGETGVGKGVLTRYYHEISDCSDKPLIRVNCSAIPETLLEAELFGYEQGAFTGAGKNPKPGLFELAEGSTLFLDEVGELPLTLQAKLLHCLEEMRFFRLGGTSYRQVNCRIVTATNRNLKQMCREGKFREDLYYRLNTVSIEVPPLRNRKEDIAPLTRYFLDHYNKKYKMKKSISLRGYRQLDSYGFPGNVRELSNMINKAMIMSDNEEVIDFIVEQPGSCRVHDNKEASVSSREDRTLALQVAEFERGAIKKALIEHHTALEAYRALGVSKATMMRKMKKYHLQKKDRK